MGILDKLKHIVFGHVPESSLAGVMSSGDFESSLKDNGCTIIPFSAFLSNPSQPILNMGDDAQGFVSFIGVYATAYTPVFVFKQNAGGGKYAYFTLNNYFGMKVIA